MGILDQAKGLLGKGKELAGEHADEVKAGLEKVEDLADKATKGKYTDKIEAAGDKVQGMIPDKGSEGGTEPAK